jgi:hypothetical protein
VSEQVIEQMRNPKRAIPANLAVNTPPNTKQTKDTKQSPQSPPQPVSDHCSYSGSSSADESRRDCASADRCRSTCSQSRAGSCRPADGSPFKIALAADVASDSAEGSPLRFTVGRRLQGRRQRGDRQRAPRLRA